MLLNPIPNLSQHQDAREGSFRSDFLVTLRRLADGLELRDCLEAISAWPQFPLRSLSPDVVEFLIEEGRFSVRERKAMIAEMGEKIDPFDPRAFYETYLERIEARPHAACFFEELLFSALSPNKVSRKLEKKPVGALRLAARPALKKELTMFAGQGDAAPSVDLILAVFFEYAISAFQDMKDNQTEAELRIERHACFKSSATTVEAEDSNDIVLIDDVDALLSRSATDPDAFDDAITVLYQMLETLEPEAPATAFDRFAALAAALPSLAKAALQDQESNALAKSLEDRGGPPAAETVIWIHAEGNKAAMSDLLAAIDSCDSAAACAQQAVIDAKKRASELLIDDDLAGTQQALTQASAQKTRFDTLETLKKAVISALLGVVTGGLGSDVLTIAVAALADAVAGKETPDHFEASSVKQPLDDVAPSTAADILIAEEESDTRGGIDVAQEGAAAPDMVEQGHVMAEGGIDEGPEDADPNAPLFGLIGELLQADCLKVASDIALAVSNPPADARVLRAASLARSPDVGITPAAQRLAGVLSEVVDQPLDSTSSALLFGATLHLAVFAPSAFSRARLGAVNLGAFGPALNELRNVVSELDYQFPPSPDILARLAGVPREPRRARILRELEVWASETSRRSGPCQPSTKFMHRVASTKGGIGAAIEAIKSNSPDVQAVVQQALDRYGTYAALDESLAEENAALGSRSAVRLPRTTVDYLTRRLQIATDLLSSWSIASGSEVAYDRRRDDTVRRTAETLKSHLVKAADNLQALSSRHHACLHGELQGAVAAWIVERIRHVETSLAGADVVSPPAMEIESNEVDRLPPLVRSALASGDGAEAARLLAQSGIPTISEAIEKNRTAGAFATAGRLGRSENEPVLLREQGEFASKLRVLTTALSRRAITLSKLDLHQQEYYPPLAQTLNNCGQAFSQAEEGSRSNNMEWLRDLDEQRRQISAAQTFLDEAEAAVRQSQISRVRDLKNSVNPDDAQIILRQIADGTTLEAVENRIALLRDGRSIEFLDGSDDDGPMKAFSPTILDAATADSWPNTVEDYAIAFSGDGLLSTEADRLEPAVDLMRTLTDIQRSVAGNSPAVAKIRKLFEDLGFLDPILDEMTRVQSAKAWTFSLRATVRTEPDNWFLPPVFGSRAKGRYRLLVADGAVLPETLVPALDQDEPAIILITARLDTLRRRELASRLRGAGQPAVLIDETLVAFVATRRETRIEVVFACGLPYGRVEPYLTDATVLPKEMFFGRELEIRTIMRRSSDGCLVYGGRQLGKSALLSHVENTRHNESEGQIVVRDQVTDLGLPNDPAKNIWNRLHAKLSLMQGIVRPDSRGDRDTIADNIKLWLSQDTRRRIIALFDETDEFMSAESTSGFREITKLKDLMESTDRAFKVVFAGLHNVQRLHNVSNSPLAHLGEPIVIGPLNRTLEDKRAAYELVVAPMRAAGFRYETQETPDKILAFANDYPSLVQEYSKGLRSQLHRTGSGRGYAVAADGPLWTIPDATLFEHENFSRIQENIRKKFRWTLDLDVRYALIAYTLALLSAEGREREVLHDGLPPRDILDAATSHWPRTSEILDVSAFEVILDEMWDLGILGRRLIPTTRRYLYCLRSPQVAAILGSWEDAVDELEKIKDREGKPNYDKATYRRGVGIRASRPLYMPLTDLQIERLLDPAAPGVKIVCGLKLLGLDKIGRAFAKINEDLGLPGSNAETVIQVEQTTTTKEFRRLLDAPIGRGTGMTVLIHDSDGSDDIEKLVEFAERHPKVIAGHVRPIFPVDALDSQLRHLAARRKEASVYLSPWGVEMLRMHMRQIEGPAELDTRDTRRRVLEASGGIPDQVVSAVQKLISAEDIKGALNELGEKFVPPQSLLKEDLIACLEPLTVTDNPELYTMLDEDVRKRFGKDLETLLPDLQAMGLVERWSAKHGVFAPSALGEILRRQVSNRA
ncbi:hypothetical protein ELG69_27185 (plasmid) [Rhizobium leguminosarum]|uniref:hypothetical protein n=1 Tax=Rhizobium leguminosarum TaxID=384 RepID=UPI0010316E15|nr:hypothetical protein [Rhizobium leguminosarum]TBG75754.1 hypothetical protein ELG69_27185 [Rhizobium leguminosarum]